jgi:dihydrofolate reductase
MGKVTADMSVSLDGFVAGPNDGPENGLGDGGERLHEWMYNLASWRERHSLAGGEVNSDAEILDEAFRSVGAVVMGRRMFDIAEQAWGNNPPFHVPVFVVTHRVREKVVKEGGTSFIFVTDGIESALKQAKAAAGDGDIAVAGGANIIQQYLRAGFLDEIQIHLVPLLLGGGRPLFDRLGTDQIELEATRVIGSPGVTHLRFRVVK